ncbi:Hypothetical protein NocV09_09000070 [Nannochloropsis oceanica]
MQLLLLKRQLTTRQLLLLSRRALSDSPSPPPPPVAVQFPTLGQGSTFSVRLHRVPAQVTITTAWIDHTKLLIAAPPNAPALDVQVLNEGEGGEGEATGRGRVLSISDAKMLLPPDALKYLDGHYHIHATIPEKVHTLQVHLSQSPGTITLTQKIEGESIDLLSKEGDVLLNKARGVKLDVSAEKGTVKVAKWVEGDLSVRAGRLRARMIKGHRVRLQVRGGRERGREGGPPLVVEALYGRQASVLCTAPPPPSLPPTFSLAGHERKEESGKKGASALTLDINRSHGALKVVATGGGVRLGGVNGSAIVQTGGGEGGGAGREGGIDVRFEALEPGCMNVLATQGGPINLLVAPEVRATLRVEGKTAVSSFLAAVEGEGGREAVQGLEVGRRSEGLVEGRLTGKAPEPSRKRQHQQQQQQQEEEGKEGGRHGRVGVGKIDLKGAQDQALKAFFHESGGEEGREGGKEVASLLVRTQGEGGTLQVKTLSWMDAIKRDFGLEHIDYSPQSQRVGNSK